MGDSTSSRIRWAARPWTSRRPVTRWTGRNGALLVAVMTVTTTGGCAVTKEPDPRDVAVAGILADGHLEVDLSDPPTRAELAVPEGRKTFIIEHGEMGPFRVTVTFSDGRELAAESVRFVSVETDGTADPTRLVIGVRDLTLEEVTTLVQRDAEQFGIEAGRVNSFLRAAETTEASDRRTKVALPADGVAAPEFLEVQPITRGSSGRHSINYLVEWQE